jgi:DNA-binding transcriptional ArsR family regulator
MADLCNEIEKFGKGIGNLTRYKIVESLFDGPKTVSEIVLAVKSSQPLVSQHLKTLKETSIVIDKRCGQEVEYSLNTKYVLGLLKSLTSEVAHRKIKN